VVKSAILGLLIELNAALHSNNAIFGPTGNGQPTAKSERCGKAVIRSRIFNWMPIPGLLTGDKNEI
jgi:hypothetical protein